LLTELVPVMQALSPVLLLLQQLLVLPVQLVPPVL
jgi:hypothetical protein